MNKKSLKQIFCQKIKNKLSAFRNQKIGLAVSGGVDSIVLLDVVSGLSKAYGLKLYVLHYNHNWRKESYKDSELVQNYCKKNRITFIYGEDRGQIIKTEEVAREKRYLFFAKSVKQLSLTSVFTAHHEDDQAETILFRLARGTGPAGLLPVKEYLEHSLGIKIFRPLLDSTKEEIYAYARENKLLYIEDKTNKEIKYKRNLVRNKILPLVRKINERAEKNIVACGDLIYSQNEILKHYFKKMFYELSDKKSKEPLFPVGLNRKKFLKHSEYSQKAFIYWMMTVNNLSGSINKIKSILQSIKNKEIVELSDRFVLCVNDKLILFSEKSVKRESLINNFSECFTLNGSEKSICLNDNDAAVFQLKRFSGSFSKLKFPKEKDKIAFVDLSLYKNKKLLVRYRNKGDVFSPLGLHNTVKLKKYLVNKKIPKQYRYNLPLLCFNNEVLWIPGYSLSEKIKVTNKPTHILKMLKGSVK